MAGGLVSLLDDVAALAKIAAASIDDVGAAAGRASTKAAGVLVDDAAVTPQYVHNFAAERELPMIKRIAMGSFRNKLLFIVPTALLLSVFLPQILTPLLMVGGVYLSYEGAEKIWEKLSGHGAHGDGHAKPHEEADEDEMVSGAIRTDFILSSEIMVIALNEVTEESFWTRTATLIVVAILITALVYGVVAVIVKVDDFGLHLAEQESEASQSLGRALVKGMPKFLKVLSTVGIAAMLWVGGHILLVGFKELGWEWPYDQVHHLEESVADAMTSIGGLAAWLTNTSASAIVGIIAGAIAVAVMHAIPRKGSATH